MKLNKAHKEQFVDSILEDTPFENYTEQVHKVVNDMLKEMIPKEILKIWNSNTLKGFLKTRYISFNCIGIQSIEVPLEWEDCRIILQNHRINELIEKQRLIHQEFFALKEKLSDAIASVRTVKQAKELMPELAQYLPDEKSEKLKYAPAVIANLASDLTKAGWPKSKENEGTK